MNNDQVFAVTLVFLIGVVFPAVLAVGIPLGKAWARRVGPGTGPDERTLAEVDQLKTRVAELEERLDFAERLLAQGREAAQLPKE